MNIPFRPLGEKFLWNSAETFIVHDNSCGCWRFFFSCLFGQMTDNRYLFSHEGSETAFSSPKPLFT